MAVHLAAERPAAEDLDLDGDQDIFVVNYGEVRIHIGELDDWTPARSCQDLGALARSMGYDFRVTVYPGARHGFDAVGLRAEIYLRNVDNAAACTPRLASMMGPILNLFELLGCMKKGATVGHHPKATARAQANVRRDLESLLVPRGR